MGDAGGGEVCAAGLRLSGCGDESEPAIHPLAGLATLRHGPWPGAKVLVFAGLSWTQPKGGD